MLYKFDPPQCQHVFEDGDRCGSPALRGQDFCYNHHKFHHPGLLPGDSDYRLPALESRASIELSVRDVLQSFIQDKIDAQKARTVLWGLQILAPRLCKERRPYTRDIVTDVPPAMLRQHPPAPTPEPRSAAVSPAVALASSPAPDTASHPDFANDPAQLSADDEITTCPDNQIASYPDDPLPSSPAKLSPAEEQAMLDSIFHPDPAAVRAYWTQHLTPEAIDLRTPEGTLIFEPPDWLPLTDDQLAYLRENLPPDGYPGTRAQQENLRRITHHFSHISAKPPEVRELVVLHDESSSRQTWANLCNDLKKAAHSSIAKYQDSLKKNA